jgi:hypothetical protein
VEVRVVRVAKDLKDPRENLGLKENIEAEEDAVVIEAASEGLEVCSSDSCILIGLLFLFAAPGRGRGGERGSGRGRGRGGPRSELPVPAA